MPQFFNKIQKVPYIRLQTLDGRIVLGTKNNLDGSPEYGDLIGLDSVSVVVGDDQVRVTVLIDVLYKVWESREFDEIIERVVEEPYRSVSQLRSGEDPEVVGRGRWVLQFGWRSQDGDDVLTEEIILRTTQNDITIEPESYGTIRVQKTLLYEPTSILNQTMISSLTKTKELISFLQTTGDQTNEEQLRITPLQLFKSIVGEINELHPDVPEARRLTLNSFRYLGTNVFNDISQEEAYNKWIEGPLVNTSSLLLIQQDTEAEQMSVRVWLHEWLRENQMKIFWTPLRAVGGDQLAWVIRFAATDKLQESYENYERNGDGSAVTDLYRHMWEPQLDTLHKTGIVENATFTFSTGAMSAPALDAYKRNLGFTGSTEQVGADPRNEPKTTDDPTPTDFRSVFYEILRSPGKKMSITVMGQPHVSVYDLVDVYTGNLIFDGVYNITEIEHRINSVGFETVMNGFQVTTSPVKVSNVNRGEL